MNLKEKFVKTKETIIGKAKTAYCTAKNATVEFVSEHPGEIITVSALVLYVGYCALRIGSNFRENKRFTEAIQAIDGPNVSEGCILGSDPRKLWEMRREWEENGKGRFDKVKELVETLDIEPGESFTIEKLVGGKHAGEIEIYHMVDLDQGFFHNEYI